MKACGNLLKGTKEDSDSDIFFVNTLHLRALTGFLCQFTYR